MRRATGRDFHTLSVSLTFLSTLSLRRATCCVGAVHGILGFLSTLSLRRATLCRFPRRPRGRYFYPRSPCGERRAVAGAVVVPVVISIHALLAESDARSCLRRLTPPRFLSTLSLRRATATNRRPIFFYRTFLSTLSLRRATSIIDIINNVIDHFYPRSPCGERRYQQTAYFFLSDISIHALLAESDRGRQPALSQSSAFLSTLSLRRATAAARTTRKSTTHFYPRSPCGERPRSAQGANNQLEISIHALLAESDCYSFRHSAPRRHFYPRSPCGERQQTKVLKIPAHSISIHALLAESDCGLVFLSGSFSLFLSTLSLRRATSSKEQEGRLRPISIHALLAESDDFVVGQARKIPLISIHALLAESDYLII